jgi:hypothetical protein
MRENEPSMGLLREAYPNIPNALEWGEQSDGQIWEMARKENLSPEQVRKLCLNALTVAAMLGIVERRVIPADALEKLRKLKVQYNHPEFLRYVAGRLGAI